MPNIFLSYARGDDEPFVILDDVWRREDVDWFDVLGPRCRAMITTRDAGLLTSLGGVHHQVELLTGAEALNLLAQAAGVERDELPSEAADLIAECGRLPLAVALCGGLIRQGFAWTQVLEQLRTSRIDRIKDPHAAKVEHENIWNAIDVSVKFLSADEQARFLELAVFPPDEATPIAALRTLWSHTAGFDDWDTDALVIKLSQRSLLELTISADVKAISLHGLVQKYVATSSSEIAGGLVPAHAHLAQTYFRKGLPLLNEDVTALRCLPHHACEANATDIWLAAMTDFAFLNAVVDRVGVKEDLNYEGARIRVHNGYYVIKEEIEHWLASYIAVPGSKELILPLRQVCASLEHARN